MTDTQLKVLRDFKSKHADEIKHLDNLCNALNKSLPYLGEDRFTVRVKFNNDKIEDLIVIYPAYTNFADYPSSVTCFKIFINALNSLRASL